MIYGPYNNNSCDCPFNRSNDLFGYGYGWRTYVTVPLSFYEKIHVIFARKSSIQGFQIGSINNERGERRRETNQIDANKSMMALLLIFQRAINVALCCCPGENMFIVGFAIAV